MSSLKLSDSAENTIENLASRIAERQGGQITPNHLIPYLPISLEIIKTVLDNMVDHSAVFSERMENQLVYEFTNYKGTEVKPGLLTVDSCLSCDADITENSNQVLCSSCLETFNKELNKLADQTGWPAHAVYEHEILYVASNHSNPVHPETLAGRSRYAFRRMHKKLRRLCLDGYVREELDQEAGVIMYYFPSILYPRDLYKRNMETIESYPASAMEEVQMKVIEILFFLGFLILGLLVLAFLHVPFPLLILIFLVAAPIISIFIWRKRKQVAEE